MDEVRQYWLGRATSVDEDATANDLLVQGASRDLPARDSQAAPPSQHSSTPSRAALSEPPELGG